jgi:hypothetical protein
VLFGAFWCFLVLFGAFLGIKKAVQRVLNGFFYGLSLWELSVFSVNIF